MIPKVFMPIKYLTVRHLPCSDGCAKFVNGSECIFSFCHLEDEEEEPHAMNQSILYNNGRKYL